MTVIELKEKLIAQINSIDDEELLDSLARTVELELEISNGTYIMSQGEIDAVNQGIEQIKNGQWVSHEEATREINEWLKK
jgi:predicted transcriptional regulator